MDTSEGEQTLSVEYLLQQIAVKVGGEATLRTLLLEERNRLSGISIQAGGDTAYLDQIGAIDQLLNMIDESVKAASPQGIGTVGQESRRVARGRR